MRCPRQTAFDHSCDYLIAIHKQPANFISHVSTISAAEPTPLGRRRARAKDAAIDEITPSLGQKVHVKDTSHGLLNPGGQWYDLPSRSPAPFVSGKSPVRFDGAPT